MPNRPVARPHPTGESLSPCEPDVPRHPLELAERHVRGMPELEAPQHVVLPLENPEDAGLPVEALDDRAQDAGAGLGERGGFGQDAGYGVLRGTPLLGTPALADVAHEGTEQPCPAEAN